MMKKILIVVDLFKREYISDLFLAKSLQNKGFSVYITSRITIGIAFNQFKPHFVIVPKIHKIPELEYIVKHAIVLYASAESYAGSSKSIIDFAPNIKPELCDYVLCWGQFDRNVYLRVGIFKPDQLIVTGNPLIQTWLTRNNSQHSQIKRLGIATSLRALTQINSSPNIIELISLVEATGGQGFYDPPHHAEHRIAFEASWLRVIYTLCKELQEYEIIIRAHPIENSRLYNYYKCFPNVTIDNSDTIEAFTDSIDVLLTLSSQSMFDAYRKRKTVISIQNLIPKEIQPFIAGAVRANFYPFFSAPESIDDLKEMLLQPFIPIPAVDDFMKNVFSYPFAHSPSEQIAALIETVCPESNDRNFNPIPVSKKAHLLSKLPFADKWFLALRDFQYKIAKIGQNPHFTYCPHLFLRNMKAQRYFTSIGGEQK